MQLSWLEDFLAVIECGSFSAAAEHRHVTQPALSRRIQSLEEWLEVTLFERSVRNLKLTPAGECLRPIAEETVRRLYLGRTQIQEAADATSETLKFAATYALSLTYFPAWLRKFEALHPLIPTVQLAAATMDACIRLMIDGKAQFLMCYHHRAAPTELDADQFRFLKLVDDRLVPVCAPVSATDSSPRFPLPGSDTSPLPFLSYGEQSGIGNILDAVRNTTLVAARLQSNFESHSASALASMARNGRGVAWVPLMMVADDIKTGSLVRAGDQKWDVPVDICLFRPQTSLSRTAEKVWSLLTDS